MSIQLYDYQQKAIDEIIEKFEKNERVLFQLSTGGGKTFCFSFLTKWWIENKKQKVIINCHRKELVDQTIMSLAKIGVPAQAITASTKRVDQSAMVYVAMIQTAYNRLKKNENYFGNNIGLMINDECHILIFDKAFKFFPNTKILGVTATPVILERIKFFKCRFCKKTYDTQETCCSDQTREWSKPYAMSELYNDIVVGPSIKELIDRNFLVDEMPLSTDYVDYSKLKTDGSGEYTNKSMDDLYSDEDAVFNVVKNYEEYCKDKKTIIFNSSSKTNLKVYQSFLDAGYNVRMFDSVNKKESGDRKDLVKWFNETPDAILCNVNIFTCVLDDTEILTERGWVKYEKASKNIKFAQYDMDTGLIDFDYPERIVKKHFKKGYEMVELNGKYQNFCVTKTHNMIIKKSRDYGVPVKMKAEDVVDKRWYVPVSGHSESREIKLEQEKITSKDKFVIKNSYHYRKSGMSYEDAKNKAIERYEIKKNTKYSNPDELTLEECFFIGLMIGDGTWSNGRYSIQISIRYKVLICKIRDLLKKINVNYTEQQYKPVNVTVKGVNIKGCGSIRFSLSKGSGGYEKITPGLYRMIPYLKKDGTELFKGFSKKQLSSFLNGLWHADGNHGESFEYKGRGNIRTSSLKLSDLIQEICVQRGIRCTVKEEKDRGLTKKKLYYLSWFEGKYWHNMANDRPKITKINRDGFYWCVTMPKKTIVTRRNGTVTIMGNTGFDSREVEAIILNRPTQSLSLYLQIIGRGARISKEIYKPFFTVIDGGGNINRFGLWSDESRDWKKIFFEGIGEEKAKKEDILDVQECENCGFLQPKSNDICENCGEEFEMFIPKEKKEVVLSDRVAKPIKEIPYPNGHKIYQYTLINGEDINFSFKIMISQIVDMFRFFGVPKELFESTVKNGNFKKKVMSMIRNVYFVLIEKKDIQASNNRTLQYLYNRTYNAIKKYYDGK